MRILIVSRAILDHQEPQIGCFEMDQARALREYGHDVRILAIDVRSVRHPRRYGNYSFCYDDFKVYGSSYPGGRLPICILNIIGRHSVKSAYKHITDSWIPDVIHGHFTNCGYWATTIQRQKSSVCVITEHSSQINKNHIPHSLQRQIKLAYLNADRIIAVSNSLANRIRCHSGLEATVIPNVLDLSTFNLLRSAEAPLALRDGCYSFVCAGNLINVKRIDILLLAFARLNNKETSLTIFGDGSQHNYLKKMANELGIADRVKFMGMCSRKTLCAEYLRSDCFVLPSAAETFGVAYIEAMAIGLPIIATRCGGPEDFITDEIGLLVEVDNVVELTEAMGRMIETSGKFNGQAIHDHAVAKFSPEYIAQQLTDLYIEAIERK